ncbi:MAG: hypothetical protein HYX93_05075 [Chloroflexi bacterium]|nr:hypothetical protein [Chloroflexota bacterium]
MGFHRVVPTLGLVLTSLGIVLVFYTFFLPDVLDAAMGLPTPYRVSIAVLLLLPLGLLMGMPFPLGIKLVDQEAREMVPWLWGINGATSVLASVLAVMISISFGYTYAILAGQIAYIVALLSAYSMGKHRAGRAAGAV